MDLMTVPTNNEEREALAHLIERGSAAAFMNGARGSMELSMGSAVAVLAAGFRRLPVSGDAVKSAQDIMHKRLIVGRDDDIRAAMQGLLDALSASQPREVTDDMVERARIHRWHTLSGRCACGGYFATEKAFTRHALSAALGGGDQ